MDKLNLYQISAGGEPKTKKQTSALLKKAKSFFIRSGHAIEELDGLNVIHIAGTKGKVL